MDPMEEINGGQGVNTSSHYVEVDNYREDVDQSSQDFADDYSSNFTNGTFQEEGMIEYPFGFKVAIIILYNTVFVTAVLGNALVCYVVFSSPRMRTVTNYLIANLAVGDLLMAILCVPFAYIPVLLQYWPFGHFLCYLLPPAQAIGVLVSSYTLVALAADRYMAILYPLRPRFRRSQACWVIAVIWVVAVISASPIAIFTEYNQDNVTGVYLCEESGWDQMGVGNLKLPYGFAMMALQYFFPLTVLIFTYSRIAMAVWGKKSLGEAEDSRDQRLAKTKRKMIKMMLTVVIVYTVSWLPLNIFIVSSEIWRDVLFKSKTVHYVYPIIHWLAMAHSVWNPVIYCYMNSRFRESFKAAVSTVPCMWKLVRMCHIRRLGPGGSMTDSRRSYTMNRLTRTNTSCTTYTFGSGSLHNLHNHGNSLHGAHHSIRKQSYLAGGGGGCGGGSGGGTRASCTSIMSQYPKVNHNHHQISCRTSTVGSAPHDHRALTTAVTMVKPSSTITSLAPLSSSPVDSTPSPDGGITLPLTSVGGAGVGDGDTFHDPVENNTDLNSNASVSSGGGGSALINSSSYVSISSKNGKDSVVTSNQTQTRVQESFM